MRRRVAAGILIVAAAGCSGDPPSAAAPPAAEPALPEQPQVRTPAGEVPPDSRVAHDPGGATAARFAGFDYAFPGPPGTTWHYHVRVPDEGTATAVAAGSTAAGAPVSVRAFRVASASDAAAAARGAMAPIGVSLTSVEVLDPATAGGCGTEAGHSGAAGTRRVPPVRVLRARGTRKALAAAGRAAAALPGLEPMFEADLGGGAAGEAWLDLHFVEK